MLRAHLHLLSVVSSHDVGLRADSTSVAVVARTHCTTECASLLARRLLLLVSVLLHTVRRQKLVGNLSIILNARLLFRGLSFVVVFIAVTIIGIVEALTSRSGGVSHR